MKTGTPPRLDGRSLDYSQMEEQPGDNDRRGFSFTDLLLPEKQLSCYTTYTSPRVHAILQEGFDQYPMFTGRITGIGPRYCPSDWKHVVWGKRVSVRLALGGRR